MAGRTRAERRAARRAATAQRVKPSALAESKKRPWPMQELLRLGPDKGGIDADQFEAGVQIVEAHRAFTRALGYRSEVPLDREPDHGNPPAVGELSPADLRVVPVYLAWGEALASRLGVKAVQVVSWVDGLALPPALLLLTRSLDLWDQVRDDHDRAAARDRRGDRLTPAEAPPRQSSHGVRAFSRSPHCQVSVLLLW